MKMKIYGFRRGLLALLTVMGIAQMSSAQVGVGIAAPDASAQLQIESTNKGLLIPRVTLTSVVALPATGLMVYQTGGTPGFYYNKGTSLVPDWSRIADASSVASLADGSVTDIKVSPTAAIAYSKLALNNSIQNSDIVANAITTSKVANGTVTTSKMADSAISGLKILSNAVNNAHIADGALNPSKINSSGATSGHVLTYNGSGVVWAAGGGSGASGAAGGDLSGTYPNPSVAASAITSNKILDGTIVDADVATGAAIAYSKLSLNNSVINTDITANAITTSKVANGTVTTSKLADSAVSGLKLLSNAVNNAHIANGVLLPAKLSASGATTGQVLTYNGANIVWGNATAATAYYGFANATAITVAVVLGGTNVPLASNQRFNNVTVDGSNTTFTVNNAGTYRIDYNINTNATTTASARLLINGTSEPSSYVTPSTGVTKLQAFTILTLAAGDVINLQLYGLIGAVTLQSGQGAGLSIQKL